MKKRRKKKRRRMDDEISVSQDLVKRGHNCRLLRHTSTLPLTITALASPRWTGV